MQGLFDVGTLRRSAGVKGVRQTGPKTFELIVDNAGTATPDAIQAMAEAGTEVDSVRTLRPTFEEVFTTLVERSRSGAAAAEAEPSPEGGDEGEPGTQAAA